MWAKLYISIAIHTLLFCGLGAQEPGDSLIISQNIEAEDSVIPHNPTWAAFYSAVIPGLGQLYNQKYWKIPIVYGGLITSIYFIDFNSDLYHTYQDAYIARVDEDSTTIDNFPFYSDANIKELRDYYRRNLELSYIATGVVYLLNIVDATVDAHLFEFDVSDDLGMMIEPAPVTVPGGSYPGLRLRIRF